MADEADLLIGSNLASQFSILKRLGAGGMGAVYLAEQADMGRKVVIKVMHPELTVGNPQAVERFKREARAVAALNHPHIVQVYVFGQAEDGRMYLAMEFIEGRDLAGEIHKGPLAQGRALKILDQVAAALIEAHSRGIVHRDLKPENIMLADRHGNPDWVKVLDFGIAKIGASDGNKDAPALTQQGAIFGTPRYMAPEQITGGVIDARTDLYALGIIFYEMLTGEHPFRANSALDYLMKHVSDAVVMPSAGRPQLGTHPKVEHILERLLAKKQEERFQSAAELQREVRVALGAVGEQLSHTMSVSTAAIEEAMRESERSATMTYAPGSPVPKKKGPWLWVVLALVLIGGGAAAAVVAMGGKQPKPEPVPESVASKPDTAGVDAGAGAGAGAGTDVGAGAGTDVGAGEGVGAAASANLAADTAAADTSGPSAGTDVASAAASAEIAAPTVRAGTPIEGFPVPEGTVLVSSDAMNLRVETPVSGQDVMAFYQSELAGRLEPIAGGFKITDPASPWTYIILSRSDDRIGLMVSRNPDHPQTKALAPAPAPAPEPAPARPPAPKPAVKTPPAQPAKSPGEPPRVTRPLKPTTKPTTKPDPDKPAKPPRFWKQPPAPTPR